MRYDVERQQWKRWPKVLVMRRDDGKERRYIPEPPCETDETGLVTRLSLDGFWYAIEETCKMRHMWSDDQDGDCFVCSECKKPIFVRFDEPSFCPICGAKVVSVCA